MYRGVQAGDRPDKRTSPPAWDGGVTGATWQHGMQHGMQHGNMAYIGCFTIILTCYNQPTVHTNAAMLQDAEAGVVFDIITKICASCNTVTHAALPNGNQHTALNSCNMYGVLYAGCEALDAAALPVVPAPDNVPVCPVWPVWRHQRCAKEIC
jgi:hypothetical protein